MTTSASPKLGPRSGKVWFCLPELETLRTQSVHDDRPVPLTFYFWKPSPSQTHYFLQTSYDLDDKYLF